MSKEIGLTILKQLGGNRFLAITGAKGLNAKDGFAFRLPRNAKDGINYVQISLNGLDLYDLEFKSIWRGRIKVVKSFTDIYDDQLKELFTETTGLNTSL